jgi:predicted RNA-binding protein
MKHFEEEGIYAEVKEDKLIIAIPLDILESSQKFRDNVTYNILDKDKMASYFADEIIWHSRDIGDQETGASTITNLIDDIFDYAYECGETWLENPEYDEEND